MTIRLLILKASFFKGQFSDSVVWGGDVSSSIKLWKIGEKPHEIKLKKIKEGCSKEFVVSSVQYWLDGKFIVKGEASFVVHCLQNECSAVRVLVLFLERMYIVYTYLFKVCCRVI